ncbi:uncharacterized protein LOC128932018 [Callithrix jacchus]
MSPLEACQLYDLGRVCGLFLAESGRRNRMGKEILTRMSAEFWMAAERGEAPVLGTHQHDVRKPKQRPMHELTYVRAQAITPEENQPPVLASRHMNKCLQMIQAPSHQVTCSI